MLPQTTNHYNQLRKHLVNDTLDNIIWQIHTRFSKRGYYHLLYLYVKDLWSQFFRDVSKNIEHTMLQETTMLVIYLPWKRIILENSTCYFVPDTAEPSEHNRTESTSNFITKRTKQQKYAVNSDFWCLDITFNKWITVQKPS